MHWASVLLLLVSSYASFSHASKVCDTCKCEKQLVNCTDLKLNRHFELSEWPNATEVKILEVKFDDNSLVHITEFPKLAVTYLSFHNNQIVRIDSSAFKNLNNLTELDLSQNYLTSPNLFPDIFKGEFLPDEYQSLHKLEILWLGSNALHTLNQDLFEHIPNLRVLSLASNPLQVIDMGTMVAIASLPHLEDLDLSYTQLTELPEFMFHPLSKLSTLNLTGNLMKKVPIALQHTHVLEELHFSDNPISVLSEHNGFSGLTHLRVLYLTYMANLSSVEAAGLAPLQSLEELYLTHNMKLKHIHSAALSWRDQSVSYVQWPPIKKLDLSHNFLGSIDSELLAHWDTVETLNLQENPWSCDCENQWMVGTLLRTAEKALGDQDLICWEPEQMRNRKMKELGAIHYHMRCLDVRGNHPEKDGKMLVGVLIGVLVALPLTIAAVLLVRRTGIGATLFARRGRQNDYSKAFYSRADSVEHF